MATNDFTARLAKLQNALLEGKIDLPTYEQLKEDLETALLPAGVASTRGSVTQPSTGTTPPRAPTVRRAVTPMRVLAGVVLLTCLLPAVVALVISRTNGGTGDAPSGRPGSTASQPGSPAATTHAAPAGKSATGSAAKAEERRNSSPAGQSPSEAQPSDCPIILLVHGLTVKLDQPSEVWGHSEHKPGGEAKWTGMIGFLQDKGYRFGGVVRPDGPKVDLPACLDAGGTQGDPTSADFFALQFSPSAGRDGLGYRCNEFTACLEQLRAFTGRTKFRIVAHSAGGLVARVYVQSAMPKIQYKGDIDRLITIGTPHLGSVAADIFGDFFGTRGTAIQTTSRLIIDLNTKLKLPHSVNYASIVVRGLGWGVWGKGDGYDHLVDEKFLNRLPTDFAQGGDEVLSVRTQNLRLAKCAAWYEDETGRAIQYVSARVAHDGDNGPHTAALGDTQVQGLVYDFLHCDNKCWDGFADLAERGRWIDSQVKRCAFAIVEEQTLNGTALPFLNKIEASTSKVQVQYYNRVAHAWAYRFDGHGEWVGNINGFFGGSATVGGILQIHSDVFGRIRGWRWEIDKETTADVSADAGRPTAEEWTRIGEARVSRRQFEDAVRAFSAALKENPHHEPAMQGLVKACAALGAGASARSEFGNAAAFYTRALEADGANERLLIERGTAFSQLGEYDNAAADFERALTTKETVDTCTATAWFLSTCPIASFRNGRRAVALATRACELTDWKSTPAFRFLAAAYAEAGRFDEAAAYQRRVLLAAGQSSPEHALADRQMLVFYEVGLAPRAPSRGFAGNEGLARRAFAAECKHVATHLVRYVPRGAVRVASLQLGQVLGSPVGGKHEAEFLRELVRLFEFAFNDQLLMEFNARGYQKLHRVMLVSSSIPLDEAVVLFQTEVDHWKLREILRANGQTAPRTTRDGGPEYELFRIGGGFCTFLTNRTFAYSNSQDHIEAFLDRVTGRQQGGFEHEAMSALVTSMNAERSFTFCALREAGLDERIVSIAATMHVEDRATLQASIKCKPPQAATDIEAGFLKDLRDKASDQAAWAAVLSTIRTDVKGGAVSLTATLDDPVIRKIFADN